MGAELANTLFLKYLQARQGQQQMKVQQDQLDQQREDKAFADVQSLGTQIQGIEDQRHQHDMSVAQLSSSLAARKGEEQPGFKNEKLNELAEMSYGGTMQDMLDKQKAGVAEREGLQFESGLKEAEGYAQEEAEYGKEKRLLGDEFYYDKKRQKLGIGQKGGPVIPGVSLSEQSKFQLLDPLYKLARSVQEKGYMAGKLDPETDRAVQYVMAAVTEAKAKVTLLRGGTGPGTRDIFRGKASTAGREVFDKLTKKLRFKWAMRVIETANQMYGDEEDDTAIDNPAPTPGAAPQMSQRRMQMLQKAAASQLAPDAIPSQGE